MNNKCGNMTYNVTVIIPVYNAEDTLKRCIDSVINQSLGFENIELILVDDNSTDNSKSIIKEYCNKYNNIKSFFSKQNHGFPGFGRNKGIELSNSDHIMFLDNDDYYHQDMCKTLYERIIKESVDSVVCEIITRDNLSEFKSNIYCGLPKEDVIILEDNDKFIPRTYTVWNKIFKKNIIIENNIKFITDSWLDDMIFNLEFLLNCSKICILNNYFGVYYYIYDSSLSNDLKLENILPHLKKLYHCKKLLDENNKQELYPWLWSSINFFISRTFLLKSSKDRKKFLKEIHLLETTVNYDSKNYELVFEKGLVSKIINFFISRRHYFIASNFVGFIIFLKKFNFLRKISRKIFT